MKPTLEDLRPDWDWDEETRAWFEAWRSDEITDDWDDKQWRYMCDTAIVHGLVYAANDYGYLRELHSRLAFMGLDFDD